MTDLPFEMSRTELETVLKKFRELKHDLNNTLAVVMALSELAQRNPAHYEKLAKAVLSRGPGVVQSLQDFQKRIEEKLKGRPIEDTATPGAPAPTSGLL